MDYIGMDVHKRETQVCIVDGDGAVVLEQRIRTDRGRFVAVFGSRAPAKILLEASTESEWVAQSLEALGHEVIVADPNYAAMYATRSRRVKTDRRDARTLAEACRRGAYRAAHRTSRPQRKVRAVLAVREALVWERAAQHAAIAPRQALLAPLNAAIATADHQIAQTQATNPVAQRLSTVPGVEPVTAVAFVATLDTVERFGHAGHVAAYRGLVPREHSSGERHHRGAVTKAGNHRLRWLLVQAAWGVWRDRSAASAALRAWAQALANRRGKRVATVALARRLAGILYALWRDGTEFTAARFERRATTVVAA